MNKIIFYRKGVLQRIINWWFEYHPDYWIDDAKYAIRYQNIQALKTTKRGVENARRYKTCKR